ncbi:hypothetical protein WICPIJ_003893 [Wickerhamomyces pijperi]|uniref:Dolichyl-diphosphooligosaccharide--protein glycosyltransferase subunit OST2 n=1 Tax=Wickerhamomyces pijperi TaxID=599730 RepID=A0A9P8TNA6_WICPI|nr:hypothetical protein WICPIJ_003893 [Wickerhamomyces pijperi]
MAVVNKTQSKPVIPPTAAVTGSSSSSTNALSDFSTSLQSTIDSYFKTLTPRLKLIDIFLAFLVVVALIQFVFVILVGNFPFNAFLGGFISTVGQFVLTVSLRLQTHSVKKEEREFEITPERALGDYVFASLILHFIIYHFIN